VFNVRQKLRRCRWKIALAFLCRACARAAEPAERLRLSEEEAIFDYVRQANDAALTCRVDYVRLRDEMNNNKTSCTTRCDVRQPPEIDRCRLEAESAHGNHRVPASTALTSRRGDRADSSTRTRGPRLLCFDLRSCAPGDSEAGDHHIDYPLGMAAYHVLANISEYVSQIQGIYLIGKAATLKRADRRCAVANVIIRTQPELVPVGNSLTASDLLPYLTSSSLLDSRRCHRARHFFA
jgi:hypothetical protein